MERVRDLAVTKSAAFIRGILDMSPRGTTLKRWIAELLAIEKSITGFGEGIEGRAMLLIGRSEEPTTVAIGAVLRGKHRTRRQRWSRISKIHSEDHEIS